MKNKQQKIQFLKEIIKNPPKNRVELEKQKRKLCSKLKTTLFRNSELISLYRELLEKQEIQPHKNIEKLLKKRSTRTMSGVATISVMTKPYPCPGQCIFCPTEKNMPKSYLSNEPSVMKAIKVNFDPFKQTLVRIHTYYNNGHNNDKIELIVQGGTWSYYPKDYQEEFIKKCFDACNTGLSEKPNISKNLEQAQLINQTAEHRIIGLTLETRPDYINEKEIIWMRKLGCTRVELGVQHTDNKILILNKRLHNIEAVINATKLLKQAGFKITYHIMPNLPGSTPEKDLQVFKDLFSKPEFQPDMLKIYPCSVLKGTTLYQWYKQGKYKTYDDKTLFDLLVNIKKIIPEYVRINRLIRDIPTTSIEAGNKWSNLRQLLQQELFKHNTYCKCIRCREPRDKKVDPTKAILDVQTYKASDGLEYFISFISPDRKILFAFGRLRINNQAKHFIKELENASIIRELHTYGELTPIKQTKGHNIQHLGFGKKIIKVAEDITKTKHNLKKIAVIAGVGVREYYKKLGYTLENTYMVKNL